MKNNKAVKITSLVVCLFIIFVALCGLFGATDVYGAAFMTTPFVKESKAHSFAKQAGKCDKNQIVFFGDSITEMYDLDKHYDGLTVYNRGISGDTTSGMLARLQTNVIDLAPSKVIILGGANDLDGVSDIFEIGKNIATMIDTIQAALPATEIFVQSVLPFNNDTKLFGVLNCVDNRKNSDVGALNLHLFTLCIARNVPLIDTYSHFVKDGALNPEYSLDGLHINDKGYSLLTSVLSPFVFGTSVV